MRWFSFLSAVVLAGQSMAFAISAAPDDSQQRAPVATESASVTLPPVLRRSEPADNVVVTLPGPANNPAPAAPEPVTPPATEVRLAPPAPDPDRPVLRHPKRDYPPDFEHDAADYLGRQIGLWTRVEAEGLLGEPTHHRPAYGDNQTVNGEILAFPDPTGRYKQLELDFDRETGLIRTLFVYPINMTWPQCRRTFGANVTAAEANKGRKFYSYLDRRLDVLVDANGKVISLGMY
jgi:hypothetical protein